MIRLHEAPRKKAVKPVEPAPAAPVAPAAPAANPSITRILQKYGIVGPDGQWTSIQPEGKPTGKEPPLLDPEVVDKFDAIDPSKDKKYLDWMLLQAGGGERAQKLSLKELDYIRDERIKEMTDPSGWDDSTGKHHPPYTQEQAQAEWEAWLPQIKPAIMVADGDLLNRFDHEIFGYDQKWPGYNGRYERVLKAVAAYQKNVIDKDERGQSKIGQINQARQKRTSAGKGEFKAVEHDIRKISSLEELETINHEFNNFFKRREVTRDIRYVARNQAGDLEHATEERPVYENDAFKLLIPATLMASIKSGAPHVNDQLGGWCISSPGQVDQAFPPDSATGGSDPHWSGYNSRGPFVFLMAKVPVADPELRKIAIHFENNPDNAQSGSVKFWDAADHANSYADIVRRFTAENAEYVTPLKDAIAHADQVRRNICHMIKTKVREALAQALAAELLG